jgi:hypothetical protein
MGCKRDQSREPLQAWRTRRPRDTVDGSAGRHSAVLGFHSAQPAVTRLSRSSPRRRRSPPLRCLRSRRQREDRRNRRRREGRRRPPLSIRRRQEGCRRPPLCSRKRAKEYCSCRVGLTRAKAVPEGWSEAWGCRCGWSVIGIFLHFAFVWLKLAICSCGQVEISILSCL